MHFKPSDESFAQLAAIHPAAGALAQISSSQEADQRFRGTGITGRDYLKLIADIVGYFIQHQNHAGAIIDPFVGAEKQYSTPAFALAAAMLVNRACRTDLLEPACRALGYSVDALAAGKAADQHSDFFTPMLIYARRMLSGYVPSSTLARWDHGLRSIVPEKIYVDTNASMNWNIVNVSGECLRRKDGLVNDQQTKQQQYIERSIGRQLERFTSWGMYADPGLPLAYDALARMWLEIVLADDAYRGQHRVELARLLGLGGLTSLLLLSPAGEWPGGGRSSHHQWNEAAIALIAQINARKWREVGRNDIAGAFKRMANLACQSIFRWQRSTGELWIVKNRADPQRRHGYELYSFHSQYNLLTAAILAIACLWCDDSIAEHPLPTEVGAYVLDLRDPFHKIVAAASGTYLLFDTSADPRYNATGLQRIHCSGVALSPLSDSAAAERCYEPSDLPRLALAPGIQWKNGNQDDWHSLARFAAGSGVSGDSPRIVASSRLSVDPICAGQMQFTLRFELKGPGARPLEQRWTIRAEDTLCVCRLADGPSPAGVRMAIPALVSDGHSPTMVRTHGATLMVQQPGGRLMAEVLHPAKAVFRLDGPEIPTHNGHVRAAIAELPDAPRQATWRLKLEPQV